MYNPRMNETKRIIDELTQARIDAGFNQTELAVRIGTTQQIISLIEKHKMIPTLSKVVKIAKVIGLKLNLEKIKPLQ